MRSLYAWHVLIFMLLEIKKVFHIDLRGILMSDITSRVKKIVVEHLGVEESKVMDSASL